MSQFEKFGNLKEKLKKAVAIGAVATVLGGAGGAGVKQASAGSMAKDKGKITSVENTKLKNSKAKREMELIEKYTKAKREAEDIDRKIGEVQDRARKVTIEKKVQEAEKIKKELLKHIGSQEYFIKLKAEFGGDIGVAKKEQTERIENLKTVKIRILGDSNEVTAEYKKCCFKNKIPVPAYFNESEGFYDPVSHEIVFSAEQDNDKTVFHEFLHASTRGNTDISENAKKELREGYKKQGSSLVMMKEKKDEYFSDPTEILVRKQILDKELEQLGVKKYGEEFTDEHYKRTMELYQRGRFSDNASDFIERTKSENFKKIMNEIAKNENTENFESNQA